MPDELMQKPRRGDKYIRRDGRVVVTVTVINVTPESVTTRVEIRGVESDFTDPIDLFYALKERTMQRGATFIPAP